MKRWRDEKVTKCKQTTRETQKDININLLSTKEHVSCARYRTCPYWRQTCTLAWIECRSPRNRERFSRAQRSHSIGRVATNREWSLAGCARTAPWFGQRCHVTSGCGSWSHRTRTRGRNGSWRQLLLFWFLFCFLEKIIYKKNTAYISLP